MTEIWPVLLGWPALLIALVLSIYGLFGKRPWTLYTGSILILPVSLYLAATPRFAYVALLLPLALFVAGLSIRRNRVRLAFAMLLAVVLFFGYLGLIIFMEPGNYH